MSRSRFFTNPYPDYSTTSGAPEVSRDAIKESILNGLHSCFHEASGQNADGGLYVGPAGLSYMYLHLSEIPNLLSQDEKTFYRKKAIAELKLHLKYYKQHKRGSDDKVAFLLGESAANALGTVFGKYCGDLTMHNECLQAFTEASKICQVPNFHRGGSDELFVGRAGYLCGALWLQQKVGGQPVPREDLKKIWRAIVESGHQYSEQRKSLCPLMYAYHGTEYLGAAHGVCAILQILLSFPEFLNESKDAQRYIRETIDYYLSLQDPEGNFPCAMDEVGPGRERSERDKLIHWCHGAPGAVYLFAKAYLVFREQKYLDACIKCGEVVWQKGLLRKGPGICHGVAGNGYVFLTIHQLLILSGQNAASELAQKQKYRVLKFAEFMNDKTFLSEARSPDCPYSLYEGYAGTVCFLGSLLHPQLEKTSFPFFDISYNYNSTNSAPISSIPL